MYFSWRFSLCWNLCIVLTEQPRANKFVRVHNQVDSRQYHEVIIIEQCQNWCNSRGVTEMGEEYRVHPGTQWGPCEGKDYKVQHKHRKWHPDDCLYGVSTENCYFNNTAEVVCYNNNNTFCKATWHALVTLFVMTLFAKDGINAIGKHCSPWSIGTVSFWNMHILNPQ